MAQTDTMAMERGGVADAASSRWWQLLLGFIVMMAISSPQYVWTLFTGPLNQKLGTTLAELQWTFSLLIILQTWCSPMQAYLVDRFGPRTLISPSTLSLLPLPILGSISISTPGMGRPTAPMR